MLEPVNFNFHGAAVRVVTGSDGAPLFVGKDVCDVLGYVNAPDAIRQHCKGVAKRYPLQTPGGMQEVRVLSEPDVLRLIVRSKLPAAEAFERWVFEDVLPAIRKTGSYSVAAVPRTLPEALRLAADEAEGRARAEAALELAQSKADAYELLVEAPGCYRLTDAAKLLDVQRNKLIAWMEAHDWIWRTTEEKPWLAMEPKRRAKLLTHKLGRNKTTGDTRPQVLVTVRGLAILAREVPSATITGNQLVLC